MSSRWFDLTEVPLTIVLYRIGHSTLHLFRVLVEMCSGSCGKTRETPMDLSIDSPTP